MYTVTKYVGGRESSKNWLNRLESRNIQDATGYLWRGITVDSAVNLDSNLLLQLVVAELLVDHDLRGVCNVR